MFLIECMYYDIILLCTWILDPTIILYSIATVLIFNDSSKKIIHIVMCP